MLKFKESWSKRGNEIQSGYLTLSFESTKTKSDRTNNLGKKVFVKHLLFLLTASMSKSLGFVQNLKPIKGYSLPFNSLVLLPKCDITAYFAEVVLHNINRACKELGRYGEMHRSPPRKCFLAATLPMINSCFILASSTSDSCSNHYFVEGHF